MTRTVAVKTYDSQTMEPFDKQEILRYAGIRGEVPELEPLLHRCLEEAKDKFVYRVCSCECSVAVHDATVNLEFLEVPSAHLSKNLFGCDTAVLFAATVGMEIDRLIARYAALSPTQSLLFQAIGAERIECLCNRWNRDVSDEWEKRGRLTCPRFSPGYGDLPLSIQKELFAVLDCPRKIGLTLNESFLMSPSKSVTAIIGVKKAI